MSSITLSNLRIEVLNTYYN